MLAGSLPTLRIDLNRLAGDRITASTHFAVDDFLPDLAVGEIVKVVEAEGDSYLAKIEGFGGADGSLVYLRVDLENPLPRENVAVSDDTVARPFEKFLSAVS